MDDKRKLLVVMLYAVHPTDRASASVETGANLAKLVGMSPTVLSRTRRQVVETRAVRCRR
ncbi:hypothetical protein ABTY96_47570 [Streptomyces sp. NPDC096057]|uniref:hypothetical protein n=1 Tax=Streptomyces sp. NPDC096057 TaxID=3155543 RepID=UPI003324E6D4